MIELFNKKQVLLLLVTLLNIAPLASEISQSMLAVLILVYLLKLYLLYQHQYRLSNWALWPIALCGCMLIAYTGLQLGLMAAMLDLLCFSYVLKLLEIHQQSDKNRLLVLGIFVLGVSFIYHFSFLFTVAASVILLVNLLLIMYEQRPILSLQSIKLASKLSLYSLPLTLMLFLLIPRLTPLWQMPTVNRAKTGLADHLNIGDIAQLVRNDELAFRVKFNGKAPPYHQLYWRTLTLDNFDGQQWYTSFSTQVQQRGLKYGFVPSSQLTPVYDYQVISEANSQHWVYSLAVVKTWQNNSTDLDYLPDFTLRTIQKQQQTSSYQLTSMQQSLPQLQLTQSELDRYRQLPQQGTSNPKLAAFAQQLKQKYPDTLAFANQVLLKITQQNYHYTLTPPLLTKSAKYDQFFFETKAGFCEHYAASFTFIMRAAGIPARLVLGYMGGEYNIQGDYYSVRQYDAHAWSEVWIADQGWVRFDPTAAVNPARVEPGFGLDIQAQVAKSDGRLINFSLLNQQLWFALLKQSLQSIDYQWTRWVVGFDNKKQTNFLTKVLGKISYLKLAALMILSLVLVSLILIWLQNRSNNQAPCQIKIILKEILKQLSQLGYDKPPQQPLLAFLEHFAMSLPELKNQLNQLGYLYYQLQYQQNLPEQTRVIEKRYLVIAKSLLWQLRLTNFKAKFRKYLRL